VAGAGTICVLAPAVLGGCRRGRFVIDDRVVSAATVHEAELAADHISISGDVDEAAAWSIACSLTP